MGGCRQFKPLGAGLNRGFGVSLYFIDRAGVLGMPHLHEKEIQVLQHLILSGGKEV